MDQPGPELRLWPRPHRRPAHPDPVRGYIPPSAMLFSTSPHNSRALCRLRWHTCVNAAH